MWKIQIKNGLTINKDTQIQGCNKCKPKQMCLSSYLKIICKNKGMSFDDRIYICTSCKQYWFYQWWEDPIDAEWIVETGDTEWGQIHEDFFPLTNKEFIQLKNIFIDKSQSELSHKIFRSNKQIYSFRMNEWRHSK